MSHLQMLPQYRQRNIVAGDCRVTKRHKESFTAPTYQHLPRNDAYLRASRPVQPYAGQRIASGIAPRLQFPQTYVNAPTDAQIAAYKDAVITNAWHEEWHKEPENFGQAWPMSVLNQPAKIDLPSHSLHAKSVHLSYWDYNHEPDGAIAQRLAQEEAQRLAQEQEKRRKMEQNMELDDRRKAMQRAQHREYVKQAVKKTQFIDLTGDDVKQAVKKTQFIDLTGDDIMDSTQLWKSHDAENKENHPPFWDNGFWHFQQPASGYNGFLSALSDDTAVLNPACYTALIPQNDDYRIF
ncbi:hypothetical protein GMOD_00009217 [Pyrenophora seminiperda CCB06]|uniref:Uncharacterized protein n=1 Tax=Pyrenophora seminiperda CCB06 TaxID=1302712 RepID=A0A3M7MBV1_9PLEO|nr:hypothetical protein GMOD_00009217 [Pyrenophora seminiperda CCB06]